MKRFIGPVFVMALLAICLMTASSIQAQFFQDNRVYLPLVKGVPCMDTSYGITIGSGGEKRTSVSLLNYPVKQGDRFLVQNVSEGARSIRIRAWGNQPFALLGRNTTIVSYMKEQNWYEAYGAQTLQQDDQIEFTVSFSNIEDSSQLSSLFLEAPEGQYRVTVTRCS